jgi:RimJ/RimL family protein N-acetyltransferase
MAQETGTLATVTIREATPLDAMRVLGYVRLVLGEPEIDFILSPEEFHLTVEQERLVLDRYHSLDNCVYFIALADEMVVGALHCQGGSLRAQRHLSRLAISVHPDWRDRGVGTALMRQAIAWARASLIVTRLELEVFTRNTRAIHVYAKLGFQEEGVRRRAVYRHGQYHDLLMMALFTEEDPCDVS